DGGGGCTGPGCACGDPIAGETCCGDGLDNDGDGRTDCDDADCAAAPACAPGCPALAPVDDAALAFEATTNVTASTTADGFADDYVFNQAGTIKLGTRRDWGGSIVFFGEADGSPGGNRSNAIDGADTGREVQIALYDPDRWYQGCAWSSSCATGNPPTPCPQEMTYLGWNPVQGGNRCNHGSGTDAVVLADGAITTTTTPLFWNPNWDRQDCSSAACGNPAVDRRRGDVEVVQRVRFVRSNTVELSYAVTNLADLDHGSAIQEFPTVYAAFGRQGTPDLAALFDSTQHQIAIDQAGGGTFRYRNFTSASGWVTFQNAAHDYGVGIFYENGNPSFQAWQADDPHFNNVRAMFGFALPGHGQVRARAYLILGSLATVATEAAWLTAHLAPFGSLDVPAAGADVSGVVAVHGWALDNRGVAAVHLVVDGGAPIALAYGESRPDVCRVWPGYPRCAAGTVGYGGSFDASALPPSDCGHVVEVVATDTDGNQRVIARQRVY
ncbi:MAG: hypothetical protein H6708_32325, partial [Kofleriaceae bacterium]|nr:hypothetical protein [Kofleriaceae bacterium]